MDRFGVISTGAQAQVDRDRAPIEAAEEQRRKEGDRRFAERDQEKRERAKKVEASQAEDARV